ncbi:hypothetical protein AWV80_03295 [Cupriavidus sp. UYMU48A]|nr:hypothetical protein AWV80_03295 [Cupriavidus sp. UYMU48A]
MFASLGDPKTQPEIALGPSLAALAISAFLRSRFLPSNFTAALVLAAGEVSAPTPDAGGPASAAESEPDLIFG